jgi:hypothetical protein
LGFPMRPLKLRLPAEMTTSSSPGTPLWVPTQGPHPGGIKVAPAIDRISAVPSR